MTDSTTSSASAVLSVVIDRFEEDKAVLLAGEQQDVKIDFPRRLLPQHPELHEGDYLTLSIQYDAKTTQKARQEALDLLNSLKAK